MPSGRRPTSRLRRPSPSLLPKPPKLSGNLIEVNEASRTADHLKTDKRTIFLETSLGGKFIAKSSGWDENRTFLEGDVLEVAVRNGRWVLTHRPAGPRPAPPPPEHYFPTEE